MSYSLVIAEVRNGVFEERNLDTLGLCALLKKEIRLLMPDKGYSVDDKLADQIIRLKADESYFLNPLNMVSVLDDIFARSGAPDVIAFTHS